MSSYEIDCPNCKKHFEYKSEFFLDHGSELRCNYCGTWLMAHMKLHWIDASWRDPNLFHLGRAMIIFGQHFEDFESFYDRQKIHEIRKDSVKKHLAHIRSRIKSRGKNDKKLR